MAAVPELRAIPTFGRTPRISSTPATAWVLPDLIGYGQSSKPEGLDYTLELFTNTLYEALLAQGVTKATLVGNSLGGGIALQMALDHPEFIDRLILMAPGCIEEREDYFKMPGIAGMVSTFGGPDFNEDEQRQLITNLVHDPVHVTDALVKERFAVARTQPKDVIVRMRTPNLRPRLNELTMPILVLQLRLFAKSDSLSFCSGGSDHDGCGLGGDAC